MAINFTKYVDIVSGVGGGAAVRTRELIGRLFTANLRVPPASSAEFTSAGDVGTYFGFTSAEYLRAAFYFGFVSKLITRPTKISFARWVETAVAPSVYGDSTVKSLATYTAVTTGSLNLTMGADTKQISAIDLSGAASLAAVAALLQTAIRAALGTQFLLATVTYDATRNSFVLMGGVAADAVMSVNTSVVGVSLAPLLGWTTGAIVGDGSTARTLTETLTESADASNNFGSFAFVPVLDAGENLEVATWVDGQNVRFMFMERAATQDEAETAYVAQASFSGVALTYAPTATEYDEMLPMMILAATDYSKRNSVANYMYQMGSLTPKVSTTPLSDALDAVRCNYYGRTQTAGQFLQFYQRGTLMGLATDPVDMNVFANEIWLKDAAGAAVMSLLLSLNRVPANATGRSQLITTLMGPVNQGLNNGTISVGKTLNDVQKLYIAELSGSDRAWFQVQNSGFWLNCEMESYVTESGATEWKAVYTLIYSKDDAVRKVEGSHVLI